MQTIGYQAKANEAIEHKRAFKVTQDSFRILGDNAATNHCTSIDAGAFQDSALATEGHRDHLQIIPSIEGLSNQQFATAEITACRIANNVFYSPWSHMQGIFISDGVIRYPIITDNTIQTASEHKITICCFDGLIKNNVDENGYLVPIELNPIRIGGGCNVHVMSFLSSNDVYRPTEDIVRDNTLEHVTDNRFSPVRNCTNLYNFDLKGFREAAKLVQKGSGQQMAEVFAELAMQFGDKG